MSTFLYKILKKKVLLELSYKYYSVLGSHPTWHLIPWKGALVTRVHATQSFITVVDLIARETGIFNLFLSITDIPTDHKLLRRTIMEVYINRAQFTSISMEVTWNHS